MIGRIKRAIKNYRELQFNVKKNNEDIDNLKVLLNNCNNSIDINKQNTLKELEKQRESAYATERDIMNTYYALEYKFLENKMLTNRILYDNWIATRTKFKKQDFNPLVSIIIPVYNGANYMKKAIDSALNQTYKNIEIIVVNDGSIDNGETEKIAKSYGDKIRYINKENGGVSSALNTGLKNMNGEYFAWLSHDDIYYSNHIEENVNYLRYSDLDNVIPYTCFNIIDSDGKIKNEDSVIAGIHCYDYKQTLYTHYACILKAEVNGGNVLIPKKAFEEFGYFEEGNKITQEKDMWARLLKKYTFINVPIITYSIRQHDKQVSSTSSNIWNETRKKILEIVEKITEEEMKKENGTVEDFYFNLYTHYKNNNRLDIAEDFYNMYLSSIK